ncbi:MAG: valine--pyruvate transaminase [Chthoniobacterales bacterium]
MFEKSLFGRHFTTRSGIESLMEDLGEALAADSGNIRMLGGGNPALIPAAEKLWRKRMEDLLTDGRRFEQMLGVYDPPKGNARFAQVLARELSKCFGCTIGEENIAVTSGGQTAFFYLFNLLAGDHGAGRKKRILLPIVPEYIGYAQQGFSDDFFVGVLPEIEHIGAHRFKYRVDFDKLQIDDSIAAICVSRPTNPSGNVLTDSEIQHLDRLAREAQIPLIIDHAYGKPFPGIVFRDIEPIWNENIILTLSLSKLGLPGTRTGIVVAHPEIIRSVVAMTSISGLANGTVGQALVTPLLESGEIESLVRNHIAPFYKRKSENARAWVQQYFSDDLDYHVHEYEGALFLWIWLRGLPISSAELYERLKQRGVLIVPGHYFGFGSDEAARHCDECIRVSFAMEDCVVEEGIKILAEVISEAYRNSSGTL